MKTVRSILLATDYRASSKDALPVAASLARKFGARVSVLHVDHCEESAAILVFRKQLSEQSHAAFLQDLAAQQVEIGESLLAFGSPPLTITRKADEWSVDVILIGAGEQSEDGTFIPGPVAEAVMQHAHQPVLAVRPGEPKVSFRKILCPVDYSRVSRRGLHNAMRLARPFDGELVVLSVIPELSWLGAAVETGVFSGAQEQHALNWESEFDRFLSENDFTGIRWTRDLRKGVPDRAIVQAAKEHQADLIVMGATGRTGLVRMMMGSVTRRVLQSLPCSVLMVHEEDLFMQEPDDEDLRVGRLLFAEAQELLAAGDYEVALTKLNQTLGHNPFHLPALAARADVLEKLGQQERAERCRRRVDMLRHEMLV